MQSILGADNAIPWPLDLFSVSAALEKIGGDETCSAVGSIPFKRPSLFIDWLINDVPTLSCGKHPISQRNSRRPQPAGSCLNLDKR